jgi:hypothetical protein
LHRAAGLILDHLNILFSITYAWQLAAAAAPLINWRVTRRLSGGNMLWTIFVILLVLWLLGVVSSYTFGGFVHILLVLAVVALVFQLITGRRAV